MPKYTNPLAHVRVAAPCSASWERMTGNESVRFCAQCNLNVYNLSGMTRRDAESLITNSEGRLCVQFYRRADGTILTSNCPVGLRALKRRISRVANALLSTVLGFFAGVGLNLAINSASESIAPSHQDVMGTIAVQGSPIPETPAITGDLRMIQVEWKAVRGEIAIERGRLTKRSRHLR